MSEEDICKEKLENFEIRRRRWWKNVWVVDEEGTTGEELKKCRE